MLCFMIILLEMKKINGKTNHYILEHKISDLSKQLQKIAEWQGFLLIKIQSQEFVLYQTTQIIIFLCYNILVQTKYNVPGHKVATF